MSNDKPWEQPTDKEMLDTLDFCGMYDIHYRLKELKKENAGLKRQLTRIRNLCMEAGVLYGKDAKEFIKKMNEAETRKVNKEEVNRMKKSYEAIRKKSIKNTWNLR